MIKKIFYRDLLDLAMKDLSEAHLKQHFASAKFYLDNSKKEHKGQGAWSSLKKNDTLVYNNGMVSGKKHWVSGIPLCEWVIVPAMENNLAIMLLLDTKDIEVEPIPTVGMENTLTAHFACEKTPAVKLFERKDSRYWPGDRFCHLGFITNHLGISQALFSDISEYAQQQDLNYIKKKVQLDIEILKMLWEEEVENSEEEEIDQNIFWQRRNRVYAFAKKTLIETVKLTTELTSSGLYETTMSKHQRYKDSLIYSTHMCNIFTALKNII